jgi:HMG box factor
LFRQHHHSQVVAEYPGKKNPEISKIIGAMWTNTSPEVKEVWQKHADVCNANFSYLAA